MHSKIFWLKDQLYHDRQNLAAEMILSYQLLFYQIIFLATHVACGSKNKNLDFYYMK